MSKRDYRISKKKYDKAVELLIEGNMTYTDIAQHVGISRNTLQKIRDDEDTAKLIKDISNSDLKIAVSKASKTLINLLDAESETVRLQSARHILELGGIQVKDDMASLIDKVIIIDDIQDKSTISRYYKILQNTTYI